MLTFHLSPQPRKSLSSLPQCVQNHPQSHCYLQASSPANSVLFRITCFLFTQASQNTEGGFSLHTYCPCSSKSGPHSMPSGSSCYTREPGVIIKYRNCVRKTRVKSCQSRLPGAGWTSGLVVHEGLALRRKRRILIPTTMCGWVGVHLFPSGSLSPLFKKRFFLLISRYFCQLLILLAEKII